MTTTLGRLSAAQMEQLILDNPSQVALALVTNQDAIIAALKALGAKLDADGGVTDTNYEALITNSLAPLVFKI